MDSFARTSNQEPPMVPMPAAPFMSIAPLPASPAGLDVVAYPYRPRLFDTGEGMLHYVDTGNGPPVVLVHGTPTWSFLYRRMIPPLVAGGHRVIAPDHLGFGLSQKAGEGPTRAGYRPQDHARRLAALLDELDLHDITLVVHDFGGPVGLSYAIAHPERVARLVILNTWMWPLDGDVRIARGSRIASSLLGRLLYLRLNASPRWLIPAAFADRARLEPAVHRQYLAPFSTPASRVPLWDLARSLLGESAWYDALWQQRARLAEKPALLLWGLDDPTFGRAYLARWREALPHAAVVELPGVGHFVQEEAAPAVAEHVTAFLLTKRTG
jgi:pimeloyl-ACP methyl ester carboxylesterase